MILLTSCYSLDGDYLDQIKPFDFNLFSPLLLEYRVKRRGFILQNSQCWGYSMDGYKNVSV